MRTVSAKMRSEQEYNARLLSGRRKGERDARCETYVGRAGHKR